MTRHGPPVRVDRRCDEGQFELALAAIQACAARPRRRSSSVEGQCADAGSGGRRERLQAQAIRTSPVERSST